jgi:CPA2 family monovalent cation:H+ antiporter-2
VGKTLKQIDLRALTGATVIAIDRGPHDVVYPDADETILAGDVLVLTGTTEAVAAARGLLERGRSAGEETDDQHAGDRRGDGGHGPEQKGV